MPTLKQIKEEQQEMYKTVQDTMYSTLAERAVINSTPVSPTHAPETELNVEHRAAFGVMAPDEIDRPANPQRLAGSEIDSASLPHALATEQEIEQRATLEKEARTAAVLAKEHAAQATRVAAELCLLGRRKEAAQQAAQERDADNTASLERFNLKMQRVNVTIKKIDDILMELKTNIDNINSEWENARSTAEILLIGLSAARDTYINNLKNPNPASIKDAGEQFKKDCDKAIGKALPTLEKDLSWGSYLWNILKKIGSCTFTLGQNPNFFARKESASEKTVKEAKTKLATEAGLGPRNDEAPKLTGQ